MPKFFVTGTCARCKGRLRFDAEEILKCDLVFCPSCGLKLDISRLKEYAGGVLKYLRKSETHQNQVRLLQSQSFE